MIIDKSLSPCPICGAKAFVMHDVVDGFEFGWSAGCPRFRINDGIHGVNDFDAPDKVRPIVFYCLSKERAIRAWNNKAERIADANQGIREKQVSV